MKCYSFFSKKRKSLIKKNDVFLEITYFIVSFLYSNRMSKSPFQKLKKTISDKYSLPILALLALLTLLFAATLLFGEAYKDIFLILMIWSLPLFLH